MPSKSFAMSQILPESSIASEACKSCANPAIRSSSSTELRLRTRPRAAFVDVAARTFWGVVDGDDDESELATVSLGVLGVEFGVAILSGDSIDDDELDNMCHGYRFEWVSWC